MSTLCSTASISEGMAEVRADWTERDTISWSLVKPCANSELDVRVAVVVVGALVEAITDA